MTGRRRIDEDRLIDSAVEEFSSRSFTDASVNAILRRAGVSKGSFYYRFNTKFDLYLHVLEVCERKKWEYIREKSDGNVRPPGLFAGFLTQARIGVQFALDQPSYHRLGIMFSREAGTTHYKKVLAHLHRRDEAGLDRAIRAAVATGEIDPSFSEDFVLRLLRHLFSSFDEMFFHDRERDVDAAHQLLEEYVRFLRRGLSAQKQAGTVVSH